VTRLIPLDADTFVAGQIAPDDLSEIAEAGVTTIVNNRPDHEEAGQPTTESIRRAALAAGLDYRDIPVVGTISDTQIEAMAQALEAAQGKLLAFCRSGNRSVLAWAVARSEDGVSRAELDRMANEAGFDLGPVAHLIRD
jgi:uncharacterized protein (TIGR01244 family)